MPVTIKSSQIKVKGTDGYVGVDALADSTTASRVAAINSAGASALEDIQIEGQSNVSAIEQKGAEVLESIPDEYTHLEEDVSDLKSALDDALDGYPVSENIFNQADAETGKSLLYNGNTTTNANFFTSDYIEIMPDRTLNYTGGARSVFWVAAYNSAKTFIQGSYQTTGKTYVTPTGTAFIRFADYLEYIASATLIAEGKDGIYDRLEALEEKEDEKVTPEGTTFFVITPQMYDKSAAQIGKALIYNGSINTSANFFVSDYIPVDGDTDYIYSNTEGSYTYFASAFYTESKTYIADSYASGVAQRKSPANAKYALITNLKAYVGTSQFEKGTEPTDYTEYGTYFLDRQFLPPMDAPFALNLPKKIYAIVGIECNIYFDNLIEGNYTDYYWDVNCTKGRQLDRKYTITPAAGDVGTYTLDIIATSKNGTSVTATAQLVIVASTSGSGVSKSVMILGDSTTDNDYLVAKLNLDFNGDAMSITTIGTRGTAPNNHEGRGGWSFDRYFTYGTDPNVPSITSDWYNPTTETFDAEYFLQQSGLSAPDWLVINLGINDLLYTTNDTAMETKIADMNTKCDAMIASIQDAMPNTKIGIALTIPPSYTQYPWGIDFGCNNTRHRYKRNNVAWVQNIIDKYSDSENDGIYIVPLYANLDTLYNMGSTMVHPNARNTAVDVTEIPRNGNVHPAESGYWQIADVYYAFFKANSGS